MKSLNPKKKCDECKNLFRHIKKNKGKKFCYLCYKKHQNIIWTPVLIAPLKVASPFKTSSQSELNSMEGKNENLKG